jgi:putative ATP-dependent endonuclease of the OLD family
VKLTSIGIKNYRSLYETDGEGPLWLELSDGVNTIVGPNNTGKSNILRALAFALDDEAQFNRQLDIPAHMAWSRPAVTLVFEVPTSGAPSRERTLLRRLDEYERAVQPRTRQTYASQGVVRLRVAIEGNRHGGIRRRVFVASGAGNKSLADDDPKLVRALDQFDKCLQFVLVRSGESLESLLQGRFREVLRTILEDDLREQFDAADASRSGYVEALRSGVLFKLGERIGTELRDLFPEVGSIELEPSVPPLGATLTGMRVTVTDAAATDLADKGTGVRGGLIVSMLQHLADTSRRSIVFAVEEPETFLHPAAQEQLRDDLENLAVRSDVTLLVTTHSPYIVSRRREAKAFSIRKEPDGRTVIGDQTSGDDPMMSTLGGLFRSPIVAGFLERVAHAPDDVKAVVVVEGETDRAWMTLAAERGGRPDLLDGLWIVAAGDGIGDGDQGGAALAIMQALVLRSTVECPVAVLVDDDEAGKACLETLKQIDQKTKHWKKGNTLFSYCMAIPNGESSWFPYEAEDLWPDSLHRTFLEQYDENAVLKGKERRPNPHGGWHHDYLAPAKGPLAEHIEAEAQSSDCALWINLLEKIRSGAGI